MTAPTPTRPRLHPIAVARWLMLVGAVVAAVLAVFLVLNTPILSGGTIGAFALSGAVLWLGLMSGIAR